MIKIIALSSLSILLLPISLHAAEVINTSKLPVTLYYEKEEGKYTQFEFNVTGQQRREKKTSNILNPNGNVKLDLETIMADLKAEGRPLKLFTWSPSLYEISTKRINCDPEEITVRNEIHQNKSMSIHIRNKANGEIECNISFE